MFDSHRVRTVPAFIFLPLLFILLLASCTEERQRSVLDFDIRNPVTSGSRFPMLHTEDGETLHMSWLSGIEEGIYALEYARMTGGRWDEQQTVRVGSDFFVNWADFPSIVTWEQEPVALHWLKQIEGSPHAYDIQIAFREEDSNRWTHITPHRDGTATEHGFVSMMPLDRDRVLAIWLDGREDSGSVALRSAIIHRDGTIEQEQVIDNRVCECCQTDMVAVDGGAVAVYRNRTEDEVRDISLVRYDSHSGSWSEPVTVHDDGWRIEGCPVNGPRLASDGEGRLAVTWFTSADEEQRVLTALSDDGGTTFSEPIRLDSGAAIGRVDVVSTEDHGFYASWMEQESDFGSVYLRRFDSDGLQSEPVRVGRTDADRNSGFPRLAAMNNGVVVAWTQTVPVMRIRTARLPYDWEPAP